MKKLLLAGILFFVMQVAGAQKVYFIYIQSDNNTPFFVKMGDKVVSATASGYLILPKLVDSIYQFTIGKPGEAAAESRFSVTIDKKDRGFLLRETDGKLSLFDLQTLTIQQPVASAASSNEAIAKRTDAFTVLLAQAANDPSLLEIRTVATTALQSETGKQPEPTTAVAVTTKEPEKMETPTQENVADTTASEDVAVATPIEKDEPETPQITSTDTAQQTVSLNEAPTQTPSAEEGTPYKPSVVTRKSESSTSEGFGLVFLDETEDMVDTIRILIPNQSLSAIKEEKEEDDSKKFLNITNTDTSNAAVSVEEANDKLRAATKRTGCTNEAGEKEFLKLRRSMTVKRSDEARIGEAQRVFRKACFSTDQIKNLSALFPTASGKYHFFDAAYGHVSDKEQYQLLQTELNDDYYVNRFKALIAKQ